MKESFLIALTLAALVSIGGCGGSSSGTSASIRGIWGGEHIDMLLAERDATVEFDCGSGTVDEPMDLDNDGMFDVPGTVTLASPVAGPGAPLPETMPARYEGTVTKDTMTLTVTLDDTGEVLGPFVLTRGDAGRLFPCL